MGMPLNILSPEPVISEFLSPDNRVRSSLLIDYELGGVALGDPTQGLDVQVWEAQVVGDDIQVRPESGGSWTTILSDTEITEISISFDQNMQATIAYVAAGVAKLYWYDAVAEAFVTTTYTGASSPVVTMDDKRPMQIGHNDILLFYILGGELIHRLQRDRFLTAYNLGAVPSGTTRIRRWGMSYGLRIQIEFE